MVTPRTGVEINMSTIKNLIEQLVMQKLQESSNSGVQYDHHAAVVKLPDGNYAIIGTSPISFDHAVADAKANGMLVLHKNREVKHYMISPWGHHVKKTIGFDHDENKSYDANRWSFNHDKRIATHDADKKMQDYGRFNAEKAKRKFARVQNS